MWTISRTTTITAVTRQVMIASNGWRRYWQRPHSARGNWRRVMGGEEFVIVLPGVNPEDAIANAERIRSAVEALSIVNSVASPAGTLTVSIGVASRVPTASDSPDHLLRAADAALYEAKHQGRNRVCFAA